MKYSYLLLALIFTSCAADNSEQNPSEKSNNKTLDHEPQDTASAYTDLDLVQQQMDDLVEEKKNSLDSIRTVIRAWNKGINESDFDLLRSLYADEVTFYRLNIDKQALIQSKKDWLAKNEGYVQTCDKSQVQYPEEQDQDAIRCVFTKTIQLKGKKPQEVKAFLELKYIDNEYIITKESDMPTELSVILDQETVEFGKISESFTSFYVLDTRDHDALGHDYVYFYTTINIDNRDTLKVDVTYYSGAMRHVTYYTTRNVKLENGYLEYEVAYLTDSWGDSETAPAPKDEEYEFVKYKIMDSNIALIEADGINKHDLGTRYWIDNKDN